MISIVIPTYNQEHILEETLLSVQEQTYVDWECIIVDDGSSELTLSIIKDFCQRDSRFSFFDRPQSRLKGGNACRNFGFEQSSGEYIQWFDADDLMHPKMLEKKHEKLVASKADFVVCEGLIFQDKTDNIKGQWKELKSTKPLLDHALGRINFQTNAPMFEREFLEGTKLWNEHLVRKQDYEFYSRLLRDNPPYEVIKEPLFFYRLHEESINGRKERVSMLSLIKADLLVYHNVTSAKEYNSEKLDIQRHFIRKTAGRFKVALSISHSLGMLLSIKSLVHIIDYPYLKNYFLAK